MCIVDRGISCMQFIYLYLFISIQSTLNINKILTIRQDFKILELISVNLMDLQD